MALPQLPQCVARRSPAELQQPKGHGLPVDRGQALAAHLNLDRVSTQILHGEGGGGLEETNPKKIFPHHVVIPPPFRPPQPPGPPKPRRRFSRWGSEWTAPETHLKGRAFPTPLRDSGGEVGWKGCKPGAGPALARHLAALDAVLLLEGLGQAVPSGPFLPRKAKKYGVARY